MIWASTQCCCLLSDTARCILLWTLPDNMLLGSARVGRVELVTSRRVASGGPGVPNHTFHIPPCLQEPLPAPPTPLPEE